MELLEIRKEIVSNLKGDLPVLVDKLNYFTLVKLPSKKNDVVRLVFNKPPEKFPKNIIVKLFRTRNADNEFNTLQRLYKLKLKVPEVLFYKKPFLILKEIAGQNLCDYINDKLIDVEEFNHLEEDNKKSLTNLIDILAEWLGNLHNNNMVGRNESGEIIVLNKGDIRLRDFIFYEETGMVYGTDFEDAYEGNHIDDIAWICCSLLDTNPGIFEMNDPKAKIELINLFLKSYYRLNPTFEFKFNYFAGQLIENLNEVMRRRNINLSLNKATFLQEISKEM
jgi:tRNA A-37 threonylcarbamoyl transferase component Bud32